MEHLKKLRQEIDAIRLDLLVIRERVRDAYPPLVLEFVELMQEVGKEPVIESETMQPEHGKQLVRIIAHFFTPHLERKFEVLDRLDAKIQARLKVQFARKSLPP